MDYLKIGNANDLRGKNKAIYRALEIMPGFLSWFTLLLLIILSIFQPVIVAYFLIAFDIYWLLLVIFLGIHLLSSYHEMKKGLKTNWVDKCAQINSLKERNFTGQYIFEDIIHLVILPTYNEGLHVTRPTLRAIADCNYNLQNIIIVLTVEKSGGPQARENAEKLKEEFGGRFRNFLVTVHPDDIIGELKGKGANQTWGARMAKKEIIDKEQIDYGRILVSVFDIDTVIYPQYFHLLTYSFFTVQQPYRASYQPIPVYHNNIWEAPFFARVAASSNTFWQMMQQIRQEKLATYSSHSMTWKALIDIDFWSTNMVSEDSRIFWHCFCYYNGDYRVEPLHYPVSMDVCMDETTWQTAKNLYKQQRRWGWGVENVPYLSFNTIKKWNNIPKRKFLNRIFVQIYGFHSWATNALIIGVIGWLPLILGGEKFHSTVLSTSLPNITRALMTFAMAGLLLSAVISTLLLPKKPKKFGFFKYIVMFLQWLVLPASIIIFGAIPGLDAQTKLMRGKYMGFWVTPKSR